MKKLLERKNKENLLKNALKFLNRHQSAVACFLLLAIVASGTVHAASADSLWNTVSNLLQTWVTRLGGVVMFVGGVMLGLGFKNDDAEGKSRGISTLVSGGIVIATAQIVSQFFA